MNSVFAVYERDLLREEDSLYGIYLENDLAIDAAKEHYLKNKAAYLEEFSEEDRDQIGDRDYYVPNMSVKVLPVNRSVGWPIMVVYRTEDDKELWK